MKLKISLVFVSLFCLAAFSAEKKPSPPVKTGVKKPGVQAPMSLLKPDATVDIPGSPDWIAVGESVWVSNFPKNNVTKIDPKTNKVDKTIEVGVPGPGGDIAVGEGSVWVTSFDLSLIHI